MTKAVHEPTLVDVVRRCLGDEDIGWDDNFYTVGGDSIVAIRVITAAAEFGLELDLLDLLTRDALRDVAVVHAGARRHRADHACVDGLDAADLARVPVGAERAWPASALQAGLIYLAEMGSGSGAYLDFIGVRVLAPFDEGALRASLDQLVARHRTLRSSFDLASFSTAVQLVWPTVELPLVVHRGTDGEDAEEVLASWQDGILARGIDWERAPGWRCHALVSESNFRLSTAIHHSLVDGWSYARLLVDLLSYYDAQLRGVPAGLPPQPEHGHERFAELEREAAGPGPSARFWTEEIGTLSPVDRCGPRRTPDPCETVAFAIPTDLWERLRSFANALRVPVKTLFLAAHGWALGRWSGRDEVVTGFVMNGRPEIEGADRLVGLFLNTVPVRLQSQGDWRQLALSAFEVERRVTPHRRFPLERIETILGGQAFEVSFNFTNFHVLRELDQLRAVRIDSWWSRDRATFPMLVDAYVDDPEHGTGVTLAFDPDLVPARRAADFLTLMEQALQKAGGA